MPSAISAPPKDVSRGVLRILATSGLLAATLISAATYFWALSQYSTDDQTRTAKRLEAFVASARSIQLRDGSLVSDLLIAYPAKWLNGVLGHFYQLNDPIVWDIHYTSVLPFALIQVIVALAFMAYLIALLIRLVSPSRWWTNAFLLASLIVMNFPMLKGLAKVLKYDILSTLFAAIAILHYIGYRTSGPEWRGRDRGVLRAGLSRKRHDTVDHAFDLVGRTDVDSISRASPTRCCQSCGTVYPHIRVDLLGHLRTARAKNLAGST